MYTSVCFTTIMMDVVGPLTDNVEDLATEGELLRKIATMDLGNLYKLSA